MAKDEKDVVLPTTGDSISHKVHSTITKPHRGKEPKKIRNEH